MEEAYIEPGIMINSDIFDSLWSEEGIQKINDYVEKKELGKRIKRLREDWGLDQKDLAKRIGIPRSSFSQLESGKRKLEVSEAQELAKLFEISVEELMTGATEGKIPVDRVSSSATWRRIRHQF